MGTVLVQATPFPDAGLAADGCHDGDAVSLREYLGTRYSPDCDWVNGHLEERNLGELEHGALQTSLVILFAPHLKEWRIEIVTEVRLQTTETSFRVPDLMVLRAGHGEVRVVRKPPLLCIEILSPTDTWRRLSTRVQEYLAMGVEDIWAFDPETREAYRCDADGFHRVTEGELAISGTPIRLSVAEVFPSA